MIGRLRGTLVASDSEGAAIVEAGGVGYELHCPLGTLGRARAELGHEVTLAVHTHVREEQIALFGFASEAERAVFRTLIGVPNVGPKLAVGILGQLSIEELRRAVQERDVARLKKVSGIGAKTAEVLTVQLRDKLPAVGPFEGAPTKAAAPVGDAKSRQLHAALVSMGYKPSKAETALEKLAARVPEADLPTLLKEALALLATT
jgi:holliday junction DNA helicase RuvA